jgi:hypothetical protein
VLLLNDAAPATSVGIESCDWPSRIVTLPVGVPVPVFGATAIFRVTIWPVVSWVADGETDVVVAVFVGAATVTDIADEVDVAKFASPEYDAVIECEPTASAEVLSIVVPELSVPLPICVVPSLKVTVPVGLPDPDFGATVAVNITLCPVVGDVLDEASEVVVAAGVAAAGVNTKTVAEYAGKL